jgi:hypothetical protein
MTQIQILTLSLNLILTLIQSLIYCDLDKLEYYLYSKAVRPEVYSERQYQITAMAIRNDRFTRSLQGDVRVSLRIRVRVKIEIRVWD